MKKKQILGVIEQAVELIEQWEGEGYVGRCHETDWQGDDIYQAVQMLKELYYPRKQRLWDEHCELVEKVRNKAFINLVHCGHCGTVILHEDGSDIVECYSCENEWDPSRS